jgi:hypothetical protein
LPFKELFSLRIQCLSLPLFKKKARDREEVKTYIAKANGRHLLMPSGRIKEEFNGNHFPAL